MTGTGYVEIVRYRVTAGLETAVLAAELARMAFDAHPDHLRSGSRDGAFILWHLDELGRRCAPVICRPTGRTG